MAWVYLIIAGIFEVVWAVGLKSCDGSRISPALIIVITSMALSVLFLFFAMRTLPLSIAYAVWTGIGVVGTVCYGIFVLSEPVTTLRLLFVLMIIFGILGLKYSQ